MRKYSAVLSCASIHRRATYVHVCVYVVYAKVILWAKIGVVRAGVVVERAPGTAVHVRVVRDWTVPIVPR